MRFDGHIHLMDPMMPEGGALSRQLAAAGLDGGLLMSLPPPGYRADMQLGAEARLEHLLARARSVPRCYPFFWIDPTDPQAECQLDRAAAAGIRGFKVICDHFYPYEARPMAIFKRIAEMGFPLLFHSGILGDGKFSSLYNRPVFFECLCQIPGLRFALAHCGWPWCDEHLAVFLLFRAREQSVPDSAKMFIDNTAGTPHIYRRETFERLFNVCQIRDRMFFGSDLLAENYHTDRAVQLMKRDDALYREFGLDDDEITCFYHQNLLRFITGELA